MHSLTEFITTVLVTYFVFRFCLRLIFGKGKESSGSTFRFVRSLVVGLKWLGRSTWWILTTMKKGSGGFVQWILSSKSRQDPHGSANWLHGRALKKLLRKKHTGVLLDGKKACLSEKTSFNHILLCGPSGSGKSSGVFIPTVVKLSRHNHSMVITDVKGEIKRITARYLKRRGVKLTALDLIDPKQSATFNPLSRCEDFSDIKDLARIIIEATYPSTTDNTYWIKAAENLISVIMFAVKLSPNMADRNLSKVAEWIDRLGGATQGEVLVHCSDVLPERQFQTLEGFLGLHQETQSGILSNARVALAPCTDPVFESVTSGPDSLDMTALRKHKRGSVLFLNVAPKHVAKFGFLLTILYRQLLDEVLEDQTKSDRSIFFLLDEFANTPPIPDFHQTISIARSYRISLLVSVQSLGQLEIYGKTNAATIIENCATKMFLSGVDIDTAERVSRMIGQTTISITEAGFSADSQREQSRARLLMSPDEVRRLKDHEALVLYRNLNPVRLVMKPWFRNWRLKRLLRGR